MVSLLAIFLSLLFPAAPASAQETRTPQTPAFAAPSENGGRQPAAAALQGRDGRFQLQVVQVNLLPAADLKKILALLVTPGGAVLDYPGKNSLMIVDLPAKLQRLVEIKELLDVQIFAGARLEVYQPRSASAEELAAAAAEIMRPAARADGFALEILPLPQVNQILVISRSEAGWSAAKRWLERMDRSADGGRRIFIYPVEKGTAPERAAELNQALGLSKVLGGAQNPAREQLRIVPDPATHTLVIYGTAEEFQVIKNKLNGEQEIERFEKRILAIRQEMESGQKPAAGEKGPADEY